MDTPSATVKESVRIAGPSGCGVLLGVFDARIVRACLQRLPERDSLGFIEIVVAVAVADAELVCDAMRTRRGR